MRIVFRSGVVSNKFDWLEVILWILFIMFPITNIIEKACEHPKLVHSILHGDDWSRGLDNDYK